MVAIRAHFDGRVLVPDEPLGFATGQRVRLRIEVEPSDELGGTPGPELLKFAGILSESEADEMMRVIDEGCEQVEPDAW